MEVNIADLLPVSEKIMVREGKYLEVRSLTLEEMLQLFLSSQDVFLTLYSKAQAKDDAASYAPVLLAAPDFVARAIALAAGAAGQEDVIKKLPPTVSAIALRTIWKLSVPDPKAAAELLSEAMELLQKLSQKDQLGAPSKTQPESSKTGSEA